MAVRHISALPFLSPFTSPVLRQSQRWSTIYQRAVLLQGLPVLSGYIANEIPSFLAGLWESVLRAVPKKKTSHMKKRHRQMAGKALKDVKSLSKCPGCGEPKRSHVLCPTCVKGIASLKPNRFCSQTDYLSQRHQGSMGAGRDRKTESRCRCYTPLIRVAYS